MASPIAPIKVQEHAPHFSHIFIVEKDVNCFHRLLITCSITKKNRTCKVYSLFSANYVVSSSKYSVGRSKQSKPLLLAHWFSISSSKVIDNCLKHDLTVNLTSPPVIQYKESLWSSINLTSFKFSIRRVTLLFLNFPNPIPQMRYSTRDTQSSTPSLMFQQKINSINLQVILVPPKDIPVTPD